MSTTADAPQSEEEKVVGWRLHTLIEAGYPMALAEEVARSDADLHCAVELVESGCEYATAAKILL